MSGAEVAVQRRNNNGVKASGKAFDPDGFCNRRTNPFRQVLDQAVRLIQGKKICRPHKPSTRGAKVQIAGTLLNLTMENVKLLVLFLTITCVLFLIIGLFRPWTMLWWEDVQNRSKVIKSYGLLAILFALVYQALKYYYP